MKQFIANCIEAKYSGQSSMMSGWYAVDELNPVNCGGWPRVSWNNGAGANGAGANNGTAAFGTIGFIGTGTAAGGNAGNNSFGVAAFASGDFVAFGGGYAGSAPSTNGVNQFWATAGLSSQVSQPYPSNAAFFLYDPGNVFGLTTGSTNDWMCVEGKAGSYASADSGYPFSVSTTTPSDLLVIGTSTNVMFYTNILAGGFTNIESVRCAQLSSQIPAAVMYGATSIENTNTTTATRLLQELGPRMYARRGTARSTP